MRTFCGGWPVLALGDSVTLGTGTAGVGVVTGGGTFMEKTSKHFLKTLKDITEGMILYS